MAAAAAPSLERPAPARKRRRSFPGRIDEYESLETLGEGTYGVVRKAIHRRTRKKVAIKCFFPGATESEVMREARCHTACDGDEAIVGIRELAEDVNTGAMFLVMELVAGDTLRDHIFGRGRPEDVTVVMMRTLIGAAKTMHDAGIIHRDLKPENVLCGRFGGQKVCDFGSATPVKPAGEPYEEGRVGTAMYNAPELMMGSRHYGTAVDMWALGCIMYELVVGIPLLYEEDDHLAQVCDLRDKMAEHGASAFEHLPPELSEAGREVLVGLLAFNPDERLTAAAALEHRWLYKEKPKRPASALPS